MQHINKHVWSYLGDTEHWQLPQNKPLYNNRVWRAPYTSSRAVDIELTAYVLQLKLEKDGIGQTLPIVKWLSAQRNRYGGFSSTQVS